MAKMITVNAMYNDGRKVTFKVNTDKYDSYICDNEKWFITHVKGDKTNVTGLLTLNNIVTLKIDED